MKNLIKFSAILVTASVFFSSCESNLSLTKRHYTSGYYVDYNKNTKGVNPRTADQPLANAPNVIATDPIKQNVQSGNPMSSIKEKVPVIIAKAKELLPKVNLHPMTTKNAAGSLITINSKAKEANPIMAESPTMANQISDRDRGEGAALSLLWLVVVIILILWLIGLLAGGFGLGGFINLLLLIALILFILWIFRIA